jgi:hypothetical protein
MDNEMKQFCNDLLESIHQMNANERAKETVVTTKLPSQNTPVSFVSQKKESSLEQRIYLIQT